LPENSGLFLDLDGTLVDSLEDICGHLNHVRESYYGLARRPSQELRPFIGHGIQYLVKNGCPELEAGELPAVIERFRASYLERPGSGGSLYPGVRETLEWLRSRPGLKIAVVTNKHTNVAEKTLAHYLPTVSFDAIAGPDSVSRFKPDPAHLLEVASRLGVPPERSWMVGDHEVDKLCAKAAGARFLAAGYGFGRVAGESGRTLSEFSEVLGHLKLG
jgi:phosphoglycolate phosphatase